jgi:DNA-binding NarL/FixJ family response regulator
VVADENVHLDAGLGQRRLSPRELQVLEMTARGLTNSQVGEHLNLSVHAVKFHLASIYRKLHVSNRTEAAVVYLRSQRDDGMAQPLS